MNDFDIYSPVSKINCIQMLISITTINKLEIYQMDVKTTLLK
jgi:hypothetical protein